MKTIKLEIQKNVAEIVLNRPEVRNAFNAEMIREMTKCFRDLAGISDVRVVFLRAEGESFCAGGDLKWMKSMIDFSEQENLQDSEELFEMYQALVDIPVPVVTLVHGHAMGGGMGLIAASDIVFAVKGTQMCFSEVRLGLAPAVISAFVKNKIRPHEMSRYFLTAEIFEPEEALNMGLIHGFGKNKEMQEQVQKVIKKICQNGPVAVRETKKLIQKLQSETDTKKLTTALIARLRVSPEGQEGLSAFFEKRKAQWTENT